MEEIKKQVEVLFKKVPRTSKVRHQKQDLIQSLETRYRDLLEVGKSEEEALEIVMASIGDLEELTGKQPSDQSANELAFKYTDKNSVLKEKGEMPHGVIKGFAQFCAAILIIGGITGGLLLLVVTYSKGDSPQGFSNWKNQFKEQAKGLFKEEVLDSDLILAKEEEVSIEGIKCVTISVFDASVTVTFDEVSNLCIKENTNDSEKNNLFEIVHKEDAVTIKREVSYPKSNIHHQVEIIIPNTYKNELSIATTSGDIEFLSPVEVETIEVDSISGDIMSHGPITAEEVQMTTKSGAQYISYLKAAYYEFNSLSGGIVSEGIEGAGSMSTVSGAISVVLIKLQDKLVMDSVSGSISLVLDPLVEAKLKVESISGNINETLKTIQLKKDTKHQLEGTIGKGKDGRIQIETVSGAIKVS